MIDMHYDFLSIIYRDLLNNDLNYSKKWSKYFNKDNVNGLVANLYFQSLDEMKNELHEKYFDKNISIIDMFDISTKALKKIINKDITIMFAIEGCDYIDINDLDKLYELGLRSVCIVWNEKNRYASGIRYSGGLTKQGKKFLNKLISLGIAIDLSHANEESFFDIINEIKKYQRKKIHVNVYASHSNSRNLCNRLRNLTDEEIYALKEVNGYIAVMSNSNFINQETNDKNELRNSYVNHIDYIGKIIGFDKIMVSTDDMSFCIGYENSSIYDYKNIKRELKKDLLKRYDKETVYNIMYGNSKKVIENINK